jgi:hypothetical protein
MWLRQSDFECQLENEGMQRHIFDNIVIIFEFSFIILDWCVVFVQFGARFDSVIHKPWIEYYGAVQLGVAVLQLSPL